MVISNKEFAPKIRTIIIMLVGSVLFFSYSFVCVLDWIKKIELGKDTFLNIIYHPITGILSVMCFVLFMIFINERYKPGTINRLKKTFKPSYSIIAIIFSVILLVIIYVTSVLLINTTEAGNSDILMVLVHLIIGILLGLGITACVIQILLSKYLIEPVKWENYLTISVLVLLVVLAGLVIIAGLMGLLALV